VKQNPYQGTAELPPPEAGTYLAFDHLATMVAVVSIDGACVFANASFESVLGLSRRSVQRSPMFDWFVDPQRVRDTVAAVSRNDFSTSRLEAQLRRPGSSHPEPLLVHVIVNQMEASSNVVVELVEIEQQTRQDREERALDQAQVTKELIRNLAHEIKNPLGGIAVRRSCWKWKWSRARCTNTPRSSSAKPIACRRWSTGCWRRTASRMWSAT